MQMDAISTPNWPRDLLLLFLSLSVLGLDQLTKYLVRTYMYVGQSIPEDAPVQLTYIRNSGSAFGLFTGQTFVLTIVAFLGVGIIGYFLLRGGRSSLPLSIGLSLQLGGAIGNIIDRIAYGYVIDFIDVNVWPIFNVADSSITLGFILLAWTLLFHKDRKVKPKDASAS